MRGHGAVAGRRQREERQLDDDGQEDDRPAPVTDDAVDILQQPEDRLGDEPQEAVVDGQLQTRRQLLELVLDLRTGVQGGAGSGAGADRHAQLRADETDDVVALAVLAGRDLLVSSLAGTQAVTK